MSSEFLIQTESKQSKNMGGYNSKIWHRMKFALSLSAIHLLDSKMRLILVAVVVVVVVVAVVVVIVVS